MPTRREFLQVGIASGLVLAGAGWYFLRVRGGSAAPGRQWLDKQSATIVSTLIPVVLDGALPTAQPARDAATRDTVVAFDRAVAGLSPTVQCEIRELFALLGVSAGRFIVAGVRSSWQEATPEEIAAFLHRWRSSRFDLLRAGYQALTQLILAAWYGNTAAWDAIGYPGPPPQVPSSA